MRARLLISFLLSGIFLSIQTGIALADGFIIPEPPVCDPFPCHPPVISISSSPLTVKEHIVTVRIKYQLAVTHLEQIFLNTSRQTIEGTYLFPLPEDAVIQQFTLWVDGKPVDGQVLSAEEAKQTYLDIVRDMRDPALLEYSGRGAFKASIFPIPAGAERRIELEYSQVLVSENGLVEYTYPLNTEKFSTFPLEKVAVSVELITTDPIRAIYSPSHTVEIDQTNSRTAIASYEDSNVKPDTDFTLYFSAGEEEALHLLSFRDGYDRSDPDGFFVLLTAPRPDEVTTRVDKDILLVIDRSGSMDGEKMRQARSAARYVLTHLGDGDRFHITSFSSSVEHYSGGMSPVSETDRAIKWVDGLSAGGSTDINRALLESLQSVDEERPTYLIFLTDGLPTVGVRDSSQILRNLDDATGKNIRLFSFGIGYDVDTVLLDTLSQQHHGTSMYVDPDESIDRALSEFYEKISTPVLTDLQLEIDGVNVYDLYPAPLPDLFQGSQLIVTGRYQTGGNADIILSGKVNGRQQTFTFPDLSFIIKSSSEPSPESTIPRLWAARKIGSLLNRIRLEGNDRETIDQIVKLSIRYGIVTPYTSYLVTEPNVLGEAEQSRLSEETYNHMQSAPSMAVSGADAVSKAREQNELASSIAAPEFTQDQSQTIKTAGSHVFVLKDGRWVDTAYDPDEMTIRKVTFLSDEYFALISSRTDLLACFALGSRVLLVDGNNAIEIME